MDFSDLSEYDLNLIRSLATGLLTNTKMNCRFEALTETVLSCIYAKGFQITPYPTGLFLTISKSLKDKGYNRQWPSSDVINEVFVEIKKLNLTISKMRLEKLLGHLPVRRGINRIRIIKNRGVSSNERSVRNGLCNI